MASNNSLVTLNKFFLLRFGALIFLSLSPGSGQVTEAQDLGSGKGLQDYLF